MNGTLAGAVTLVGHGNAFLHFGGYPPDLSNHAGFRFNAATVFSAPVKRGWFERVTQPNAPEPILANDIAEWFRELKKGGTTRLWITTLASRHPNFPTHIAVAFAGSHYWGIFTEGSEASWFWRGTDELLYGPKDERPADKRIWKVTYHGVSVSEKRPETPKTEMAREELRKTVQGAIQFCEKAKLDFWQKWFVEALDHLASPNPQPKHYADILPGRGYRLEARQLLAAASASWVFGGMGWWNDLAFEGSLQSEYKHITPRLYDAVTNGIVAAANAFDPAA